MSSPKVDIGAVQREFEGLDLGDKRLEVRAVEIAGALAAAPSASFPEQLESAAGREGLYRLLSNEKVTLNGLIERHVQATRLRIGERGVVRVVHDTTALRYSGDREGLGIIRGNVKGYFAHVSLAIGDGDARTPLGVLAASTFVREDAVANRGLSMPERRKISIEKKREERESFRWEKQALAISESLPPDVHAIHVMDREADDFALFAALTSKSASFVVRVSAARITADGPSVRSELSSNPTVLFRTVHLSPRPKKKGVLMTQPVRPERDARLHLRWGTVTIKASRATPKSAPQQLTLNVVHVFEPAPPAGEEPVEWMLFTSEEVSNKEQAAAIVDHYRARWIVEEYFKALKTGCAIEKRQLMSYESLARALGFFLPIAWHLLLLRHAARSAPESLAGTVFSAEQLLLLSVLLKKRRYILPQEPTVRDAMLGVAALGGHIRNNGDPGWQVLGRGFVRFVEAEEVWSLARSDQS